MDSVFSMLCKNARRWPDLLLVVLLLSWADTIHAQVFQGEFADPGEEAVVTFVVNETIPGQLAKVRIRTYGKDGGTVYTPRAEPSGSPLPQKTIIPDGGFHSRIRVFDSSDVFIAEKSEVWRTEIGTIPLESTMELQLPPGTYKLQVTVANRTTFTDSIGHTHDGKWAVQVVTFADLVNYVIPEVFSGGTGVQVDAVFAVAKAMPWLLDSLTLDKTTIHSAAAFGGFDHFNWFQLITSISDPLSCRGTGVDPSVGGNCVDNLSQAQLNAMKYLWPTAYSEAIANFKADDYLWYWDENLVGGRSNFYVKNNTTEDKLHYEDNPSGFTRGTTIEFQTYLVGVLPGGEGYVFAEGSFKKTAFKWRYNQNITQDAVVDNVEFFQSDDRAFFIPQTGGTIEFLGVLDEADWVDSVSSIRAAGIEVVGLPEDYIQPPSAPVITHVSIGNRKLTVYLNVEKDGGAALAEFIVDCTDGENTYSSTNAASPVTISGLTNGVAYTCTAKVSNGTETSATSLTSNAFRPNQYVVSAGGIHSCALDDSGVTCWGNNDYNQTAVPALKNPVKVSAGGFHSCALDDSGVVCWGYPGDGQTSVPTLTNPVAVSAGGFHSCALDDTGVVCWGSNAWKQTDVPELANPKQVSSGGFHTCALDDNGVVCWGRDDINQIRVPRLAGPEQVNAGYYHNCALDDYGVRCWGNNGDNQTIVPPLNNSVQVVAGLYHSCALDESGVHCWGSDNTGQSSVPALSSPRYISTGNFHSCALDNAGIHCWGSDEYNQANVLPLSFGNLDSDGDGTINSTDTDDDDDGLSDEQEEAFGTNPLQSDSDGDGISDKVEIEKGTDPLIPDESDATIFNNGFENLIN